MDPRSNSTSGTDLPQIGNDMGHLPPIHTPQSFHAPDTAASHFDAQAPQVSASPPQAFNVAAVSPPLSAPIVASAPAPSTAAVPAQPDTTLGQAEEEVSQFSVAPTEDTDNGFDEEWVDKAREVVARTHNDPYLQSQELGKLKAQYIKLRYNKDVKVEE